MYRFVKRGFCILASLLAIVVTSPVWVIAIVGIEVSDPGPVFYMAKRVGKDGKIFRMFKFRSMRIDKQANESNFKADSERIFPWGNLIRRLKIDELPQLLNCLLGTMCIIGPRPASVDQVAIVRAGEYAEVNRLTPGLSGPSALYDYIYGDTVEEEDEYERLVLPTRLALDLYYVRYGVQCLYDLKMIWQTVVCILNSVFGRSSEKILRQLEVCASKIEKEEKVLVEV